MTVNIDSTTQHFCGNKIPWKIVTKQPYADITFSSKISLSKDNFFKIQFYGSQILEDTINKWISQPGIINELYVKLRFSSLTYHFISENQLERIVLDIQQTCKHLKMSCYDGPGKLSPLLSLRNNASRMSVTSSTCHLTCYLSISKSKCKFLHVTYSTENAELPSCMLRPLTVIAGLRYRGELRQNCIYNSRLENLKHLFDKYPMITIDLFIARYDANYFFSEDKICMYGGVHVFKNNSRGNIEQVWSTCSYKLYQGSSQVVFNTKGFILSFFEYNYQQKVKYGASFPSVYVTFEDSYIFIPNNDEGTNGSYNIPDTVEPNLPPTATRLQYAKIHALYFSNIAVRWSVRFIVSHTMIFHCLICRANMSTAASKFLNFTPAPRLVDAYTRDRFFGQDISFMTSIEVDESDCFIYGGWAIILQHYQASDESRREDFVGNTTYLNQLPIHFSQYRLMPRSKINWWLIFHLHKPYAISKESVFVIKYFQTRCLKADFYLEIIQKNFLEFMTFELEQEKLDDNKRGGWLWLSGCEVCNIIVTHKQDSDSLCRYPEVKFLMWRHLMTVVNQTEQERKKFIFHRFR